jgi:hypothetical protein
MFIIAGQAINDPALGTGWAIFYTIGGLGWFSLFLVNKIGPNYFMSDFFEYLEKIEKHNDDLESY